MSGGVGPTASDAKLGVRFYDPEEDLVEAALLDGRARARAYVPARTAVVLGRGSRPEVELRLETCLKDGVPLLRRRGGGCAVVLDPGNVVVAAAMRADGFGDNLAHFARLTDWLVAGLDALGARGLRREAVSDLAAGDRKVGGACIYRGRGVLLYSATVLVRPEIGLVERYVAHPPREPAYRRGRVHARFMGALGDRVGPSAELVATRLAAALGPPPEPPRS